MKICIDFDGTCVTHEFPKVGKDIGAVPILKSLVAKGHELILFTMRSDIDQVESNDYNIHKSPGKYLTDAVNWFKEHDIKLFGINVNPDQRTWTNSPKCYGELYIDDAALGCPLTFNVVLSKRPFVDWGIVEEYLTTMKLL